MGPLGTSHPPRGVRDDSGREGGHTFKAEAFGYFGQNVVRALEDAGSDHALHRLRTGSLSDDGSERAAQSGVSWWSRQVEVRPSLHQQ